MGQGLEGSVLMSQVTCLMSCTGILDMGEKLGEGPRTEQVFGREEAQVLGPFLSALALHRL